MIAISSNAVSESAPTNTPVSQVTVSVAKESKEEKKAEDLLSSLQDELGLGKKKKKKSQVKRPQTVLSSQ